MTIKKQNAQAPAAGGAAISDRFRLNDAGSSSEGSAALVNKKAAGVALIFGLIALHVMALLTYMLFRHWEFLMPA